MSTSIVLTKAATIRLSQSLSDGPPLLPFPIDWTKVDPSYQRNPFATREQHEKLGCLTPEQQEANLLHVATWIVGKGYTSFNMKYWHLEQANECGTTHCIAGFAQVMSGPAAWSFQPGFVGQLALGSEAGRHFTDDNDTALEYLRQVIARNS